MTATDLLSSEYNTARRADAASRVTSALASGRRSEYLNGLRSLRRLAVGEEDYRTVDQAIRLAVENPGTPVKATATPWLLDLLLRHS